MIPKIIHYCWFGQNPIPSSVQVYINSWKKYLPEFEIKEWNETNFNINARSYTREAYYAKKYAFVSDVARLVALSEEGGLYLDTDILIKKDVPRTWFENKAFAGFEHDEYVGTGILACEAHYPIIDEFLHIYDNLHYFEGFRFSLKPNVGRLTEIMKNHGYEMNNTNYTKNGFELFPQIILCGKDWRNGRYDNEETVMLHDFQGTWGRDYENKFRYLIKMWIILFRWYVLGDNIKQLYIS